MVTTVRLITFTQQNYEIINYQEHLAKEQCNLFAVTV